MVTLICFILMYFLFKTCDWIAVQVEHYRIRKVILADPIKRYELLRSGYSIKRVLQLRKMPYSQYLNTEHWQVLREAIYCRDGYQCADCGAGNNIKYLEAHHCTYTNRGNESLNELTTLCRDCHEERHTLREVYE